MKIGTLDLDTNYEYMIVYRDKRYNTINTWTLNESAFQTNYKQMKKSGHVEFLGVYKKLDIPDGKEEVDEIHISKEKQ